MSSNKRDDWKPITPQESETVLSIIASFRAAQKAPVKAKDPVDGLLASLGLDRQQVDSLATGE